MAPRSRCSCNMAEMGSRHPILPVLFFLVMVLATPAGRAQQAAPKQSPPSGSSSSTRHARKPATVEASQLDPGAVNNGLYRNAGFAFACKIPAGWVLRTDEMNTREDQSAAPAKDSATKPANSPSMAPAERGRVLLAAFSRPPEAKAEDVNSSILIVAETAEAYPGLKEPAQYFGPVTEVAKAQGFEVINEPYEFVQGTKTMVRGDFQRDVGTRMMWQSTLVILARGYVVSLTFIGGTEDEVEELIEGLSFGVEAKPRHS
jgi:hypothetical protein